MKLFEKKWPESARNAVYVVAVFILVVLCRLNATPILMLKLQRSLYGV